MNVKVSNANTPVWKTVTVKSHIPEPLKKLDELAHNLWWAWNNEATALFSSLDKDLWRKVDKNPIELLTHISYKRLKEIASDEEFLARMDKVYTSFRQYMDVKPDAKRQERHDQVLRDRADTDIERTLRKNPEIFGRQCQSHAEHDDSDDDRLTGELVGYRINEQWVIYPSHHCRYKECDYCNSDYHQ